MSCPNTDARIPADAYINSAALIQVSHGSRKTDRDTYTWFRTHDFLPETHVRSENSPVDRRQHPRHPVSSATHSWTSRHSQLPPFPFSWVVSFRIAPNSSFLYCVMPKLSALFVVKQPPNTFHRSFKTHPRAFRFVRIPHYKCSTGCLIKNPHETQENSFFSTPFCLVASLLVFFPAASLSHVM